MVGTNDLKLSEEFYDKLPETVGLKKIYIDDFCIGYSQQKDSNEVEFYITKPANGKPATFGNGTMITFTAKSKESVINIYNLALKLGAKDEGSPGPRHEEHFYAYFRDLDGNKICIYCSYSQKHHLYYFLPYLLRSCF